MWLGIMFAIAVNGQMAVNSAVFPDEASCRVVSARVAAAMAAHDLTMAYRVECYDVTKLDGYQRNTQPNNPRTRS